jgi:uncharacterized protein
VKTRATKSIEAIVKITERCNINCSYCYMFNLGNEDYRGHSAFMSEATAQSTATFLREGALQLSSNTVRVILHGGEPLLLKKVKFDKLCAIFLETLRDVANVEFSLQTNAMLIDEEWIDIFQKYRISVGVSIDGPAHLNDENRQDHQGRGTHSRVLDGLLLLQSAAQAGRIGYPGILVVINPEHSGREVFQHIVSELKVTYVNFLLPMRSHDMPNASSDGALTQYLLEIAQGYLEHKTNIEVRIISQFLGFISGASPMPIATQLEFKAVVQVSISTDGHLSPDDELKPLNIFQERETVLTESLATFLNSEFMDYADSVGNVVPTDCRECCWQNYCRGGAGTGSLSSRYSHKNGFDNKSVHCESLRIFYSKLAHDAMRHGLAESLLISCLDNGTSPYLTPMPNIPASQKKIIPILTYDQVVSF